MLSFIIIARNEEKHLQNCFASVFRFIKTNNISKYEVIYIDSNSSDSSVNIAQSYNVEIIHKITSGYNAAVARNMGVKLANGNTLFFIDGDMEIFSGFYNQLIEYNMCNNPFITGSFIYKFPDKTEISFYEKPFSIKKLPFSNGTFIIDKDIWDKIGGMDEKFKKAQDIDFILSAAKKGVLLKRIEAPIAKHYTTDYNHPKRLWRMLFSQLYLRSLLYRKHFFTKHVWPQITRREYTLISLILCSILVFITHFYLIFAFYAFVVIIKSTFQKHRPWYEFFMRLPYYPLRDISVFLGFFFFWPGKPKSVEVEKIR